MTAFRFPLDRVLAWRRTQLEIEEGRYRQVQAALAALDRARAELEASAIRAETEVRALRLLSGAELAAHAAFQSAIRARKRSLSQRRAEAARAAEAQLKVVLDAQRRCRLLERLRDTRFAEWQAACDREWEQLAAESHLARWRPPSQNRNGSSAR